MQTDARERVGRKRTFRTTIMDPDPDGILIVQRVTMDDGMIDVTNVVRLDLR